MQQHAFYEGQRIAHNDGRIATVHRWCPTLSDVPRGGDRSYESKCEELSLLPYAICCISTRYWWVRLDNAHAADTTASP